MAKFNNLSSWALKG